LSRKYFVVPVVAFVIVVCVFIYMLTMPTPTTSKPVADASTAYGIQSIVNTNGDVSNPDGIVTGNTPTHIYGNGGQIICDVGYI
jgi:hypothetical protein